MRTPEHWEQRYVEGSIPWDTGRPDSHLAALVTRGVIAPCRALEIGCGTGTNAVWLARQGFRVTATEVSATALEHARARVAEADVSVELFHSAEPPADAPPFAFAFDRGVFHSYDDPAARVAFAAAVAAHLEPGGRWLSLAGSTDGPPRDTGPPRLSLAELAHAIEPSFEILSVHTTLFDTTMDDVEPRAWVALMRRRS